MSSDQTTSPRMTYGVGVSLYPLPRQSVVLGLADLADVMLRVELKAELGDEIELSLQEIDVVLLVGHDLLEQVARHVIAHRVTVGGGFLIECAGGNLGGQVAVEHLPDVLADTQRVEHLHV